MQDPAIGRLQAVYCADYGRLVAAAAPETIPERMEFGYLPDGWTVTWDETADTEKTCRPPCPGPRRTAGTMSRWPAPTMKRWTGTPCSASCRASRRNGTAAKRRKQSEIRTDPQTPPPPAFSRRGRG